MNKTTSNLLTVCAASVLLAVALSACGGGGNGPMTGGETMPPNDSMAEYGHGLTVSRETSSPEAMSSADTIESLIFGTNTPHAVVSAPLKLDVDDMGRLGAVLLEEDDSAYIESIANHGLNDFTVEYVVDGRKTSVHFQEIHRVEETPQLFGREVNNTYYWWTGWTIHDEDDMPVDRHYFRQGFWDVLNNYTVQDNVGFAGSAVVGVPTPAERLASLGSATYVGHIDGLLRNNYTADLWWDEGDAQGITESIRGDMTLTAEFSDGSIGGSVSNLRRFESLTEVIRYDGTNSISISDGEIDGNRFHAMWQGQDDNMSSAPENSVRGFEGSMLGEFYGPQGEEVGGVLTGQRESTNQVINGVFGAGRQQ